MDRKRFFYGLLVVLPAQFIAIVDALVCICCLGYYHPGWEFDYFALVTGPYLRFEKRWLR